MFNLLFSQVYTGNVKLISAGFNQLLPKLYAFSMMWTLNARRSILKRNTRLYTSESSMPRPPVGVIGYLGVLPSSVNRQTMWNWMQCKFTERLHITYRM